jgi:hypothetical protein
MDMLIMLTSSVPQPVGEIDHPPRALSTAYIVATRRLTRTGDSKPASPSILGPSGHHTPVISVVRGVVELYEAV